MQARKILIPVTVLALALTAFTAGVGAQAPASGNIWPEDELAYEFIGQVKNFPPAGPGLPATSVQYGYLSYVTGLAQAQVFAAGPANEKTAHFTFYNESVTRQVTVHGTLRVIVREGTTNIYYDDNPLGDRDLTADFASNASTFRRGVVIQTTTWRHQVVFDNTTPGARTDLFFVNFWHTVASAESFNIDSFSVRLGKAGDRLLWSLVGGPDPAGLFNGKFAGNAVMRRSGN